MNEENRTNTAVKVPIISKIGYGFGELGSQCSWTLISSYLTLFYTDVVGLTPVIISAIMMIARVWDAVNDPMFGSLAENTRTKWGRFRPYIMFGAPILALFSCLTFLNLDIGNGWKAFWCAFTYIACGMVYTVVNMSTGCLANSMTTLNTERVSLNAYKGFFGGIASLVISAVAMPMILYFGGGSTSSGKGYFLTALIFAIVCVPCFWICAGTTKEIVGGGSKKKGENAVISLLRSFRAVFKDRNAVLLVCAMLMFLTGVMGRIGIMSYYFVYVLDNAALMSGFATAMSAGMIVVNFYAPYLLNHIDKKWVGVLSACCEAACCVIFFLLGQSGAAFIIVVVGFLYGALNMCTLVCFTLAGEIIDDNWVRTGIRSDGVIYSCISFSTKLGNAIGGSIGILALGAVGFVANTDMSAGVLTNMNAVINFGPAAFYILAAVFFSLIKMTNQRARDNEKKIEEMRAAAQPTAQE